MEDPANSTTENQLRGEQNLSLCSIWAPPPSCPSRPGQARTPDWREIVSIFDRALNVQETALGFITRQGALVLAPPAGSTHVFRNTDRVVVFAGRQDESEVFEF